MSLPFFLARRIHFAKSSDNTQRVSPPAIRIAIAGIAIGVAVMLVSVAIVVGFKQEVRQKVVDFSGHMQLQAMVANNTYELPPITVNDSLNELLGQYEYVKGMEPFITKPAVLKTDSDFMSVVLKGIVSDDIDSRGVVLSRTIADKLKLKVGDVVQAFFVQTDREADVFALGAENTKVMVRRLTVDSLYESHFSEIDQQMVLGNAELLQGVCGWDEDMYSAVTIDLKDFDQMEDAYYDLNSIGLTDSNGTPLYALTIEQLNPMVFSWLELLDTNVWVILILIAAVAAFTMISGLLIIILERTQMIAILKAQGLDNARLRRMFLWVALFLTGKGMLWGNLIGIGLCMAQQYWHLFKLDPATYYLEWVPIHLTWPMVLLVNIGTVVITLLVLLAPSALVAKISPSRVLSAE